MKKLFSFILLFAFNIAIGQTQTPEYGEWQTLYQETQGENVLKAEISFKVSVCGPYGLKGYSRWRTRNEISKNATLTFKFDWVDCDNKSHTENMRMDLNKQGIDDYQGNWFLGKTITKLPYNIKINGTPAEQYNSEKKENYKVVDGTLIPNELNAPENDSKKKEMYKRFGKTRPEILNKKDNTFHLSPEVKHRNGGGGGTRGENTKPKIVAESLAITVQKTDTIKKKTVHRKK